MNTRKKSRRSSAYGYVRKGAKFVGTVAKVVRDVNYLRSIVNVERKYIDTTATLTPSTTGVFTLLNASVPGTSATTRNGISIKLMSFLLRFTLELNATATLTQVRCVVVQDRIPQATSPASSEVFTVANSITSPLNLVNTHRFKIHYDKIYSINSTGTSSLNRKFFKKLRFHSQYNTVNGGTIADFTANSFLLYTLSDEATNTPSMVFYSRVRFVDN